MTLTTSQRIHTRAGAIILLLGCGAALGWALAGLTAGAMPGTEPVRLALPYIGQLSYGRELVWPVTRVVALMLILACCLAYRHTGMAPRTLLAGVLCFAVMAGALAATGAALWHLPGAPARISCIMAVTLLVMPVQRAVIARLGAPATVLGAMLVLLAMLLVLSTASPGDSYLLAWPLPAALAAFGTGYCLRHAAPSRLAVAVVGFLPAALLIGPRLLVSPLHSATHGAAFMLALAAMLGCATVLVASTDRRQVP
ncbi:hypothetical protein KY495_06955 [Massilia sp. PAMC28688]|uniref:hypothetical protein n=1 Tax=Massilia sp. PAMC28688 TaxID=2861283 RepID=UPI001C62C45F|nr:hypothetical protein [Massilia sp. PAMC28688]QYF94910.1 hypothetical protein KY495_06955 [Massilia sp. PAMC28688]